MICAWSKQSCLFIWHFGIERLFPQLSIDIDRYPGLSLRRCIDSKALHAWILCPFIFKLTEAKFVTLTNTWEHTGTFWLLVLLLSHNMLGEAHVVCTLPLCISLFAVIRGPVRISKEIHVNVENIGWWNVLFYCIFSIVLNSAGILSDLFLNNIECKPL